MHVLLIHQAFASITEAGGTRHYEMAEYLVGQGHEVTIISSRINYLTGKNITTDYKQSLLDGKLNIIRTYTYPAFHKSFVHRVFGFFSFMASSFWAGMRVKKVDLIWGTSPPIFQGFTAWLISSLRQKPFLFEVRDLWPAFAIAVGVLKNKTIIRMSEWLERFLYKRANIVVVNSPGYLEHIEIRGAKKTALVPNGADVSMFDQCTDIPEPLERLNGKFVVLYAGAHGMSNDLGVLLDVAEKIKETKNIHFVFVGDGKEKQNLVIKTKQKGLDNVTWVGSVPKDKVAAYLKNADIGVAILKPIEMYKLTYPNKVFDYMAAALPVLLVIDGVVRKVVEEADAGIFAQPGNADDIAEKIITMYKNQEKLNQYAKNGKRYIKEKFSREIFSQSFLQIMEELKNG